MDKGKRNSAFEVGVLGFSSPLVAEKLDDDHWQIIDGFCFSFYVSQYLFREHVGKYCLITIYPGAVTDFASVPWPISKFLPQRGIHVDQAAVVHDLLYQFNYCPVEQKEIVSRHFADNVFLLALLEAGMPFLKRRLMYAGVRLGGWKPFYNYRKRLKQKCSPMKHYTIADKPIEIRFFDSLYTLLMEASYLENKILKRRISNGKVFQESS